MFWNWLVVWLVFVGCFVLFVVVNSGVFGLGCFVWVSWVGWICEWGGLGVLVWVYFGCLSWVFCTRWGWYNIGFVGLLCVLLFGCDWVWGG